MVETLRKFYKLRSTAQEIKAIRRYFFRMIAVTLFKGEVEFMNISIKRNRWILIYQWKIMTEHGVIDGEQFLTTI